MPDGRVVDGKLCVASPNLSEIAGAGETRLSLELEGLHETGERMEKRINRPGRTSWVCTFA